MRTDIRSLPLSLPATAEIPEVIIGSRSSQIAQALSVLKNNRARNGPASEQASMRFIVCEEDGGAYRWSLVSTGGEHLARSARFSSYQEAARAARVARAGAASAAIEERPADNPPADLAARRKMAKERDDHDARRWLDDRAGESTEEVTT